MGGTLAIQLHVPQGAERAVGEGMGVHFAALPKLRHYFLLSFLSRYTATAMLILQPATNEISKFVLLHAMLFYLHP